jgi:hypothetical protein
VIVYYYMKNLSWILVCNFAAIVCFEKIKESQNSVDAQTGSHEIRLEIHLSKNWRTNHLVTEKLYHQYKGKGDSLSLWVYEIICSSIVSFPFFLNIWCETICISQYFQYLCIPIIFPWFPLIVLIIYMGRFCKFIPHFLSSTKGKWHHSCFLQA